MNSKDMVFGNPGKSLFLFALPIIFGNLFQQFYNMIDSIVVGRYVGEEALAAVGASYSFTTVFIMVAIGGGLGVSVLTSQYLGAGRYGRMKTSIYTSLFTFLGLSILLAVIGFAVNPTILALLRTPENIIDSAVLYLQIYFCGLPFLFMYNVLSATFNALGRSKIPLFLLLFSSVLNVILDLVFVCMFHWGVAGVAVATVIAQGVSAVAAFVILMRLLYRYQVPEDDRVSLYDKNMLWSSTKIAIPSIIQQSIVSIGLLLVQSAVNRFGSSVLAGYSAAARVESICIVPMIATGNAVSTFTAQNLGAGQPERVKRGYRLSFGMIAGFAVLICIVVNLFGRNIIAMFMEGAQSGDAFETGTAYLQFISFFVILLGSKAATDGVLRGAGDVGVYMVSNLVNLGIRVFVANYYAPRWGVQAVWFAEPMGWGMNFLISFMWYMTGRWQRKNLIRSTEQNKTA